MDRLKLMVVGLVALLAAPFAWGQLVCVERQFITLAAPMEFQRDWSQWPVGTVVEVNVDDVTLIEPELAAAGDGTYTVNGWFVRTHIPIDVPNTALAYAAPQNVSYWVESRPEVLPLCRIAPPPTPAPEPAAALTAEQREREDARRFQILRRLEAAEPDRL